MTHKSTEESVRELGAVRWRKSSYSGTGECFEIADLGRQVAVRNSKHPRAGTVLLSREVFSAWIAGCRAGEFDELTP